MNTKEELLGKMCSLLEVTDETMNKFELLERFYNEAYNQGWADCFWKSRKGVNIGKM